MNFKSPYYFYIFSIIDIKNEKEFPKLGYAEDVNKRLNEWKNKLKKEFDSNNYIIKEIYRFPGVIKYNNHYILIGNRKTNVTHRDRDIRKYLKDIGITTKINYNIFLKDKNGKKRIFSIEGLKFTRNINDNELKEIIQKFIELVKEKKVNEEYFYTITSSYEYKKHKYELLHNNKKQYFKYNNVEFYNYFNKRFDINIPQSFFDKICLMNCFIKENDLEKIFLQLLYNNVPFEEKKELLKEYKKINEEMTKCINNWLKGKEEYDGETLF